MKSEIYYCIALCLFLSIFQPICCETNLPKAKLDQIRLNFKKISPVIFKIGQSKIPNVFGKDLDAINQILNAREITDKSLESVLSKLNKIKSTLEATDGSTKVSVQIAPGKSVEKSLENFLATTYRKLTSDIKLTLQATTKITYVLNANDLKLLKDSFKPIFWGFYDLFEHPYYKYLETIREALHFDLDKEKVELIRDTMDLLLSDLNDENQNQTMMLETSSYQRFNLNIRDFKELIKKFINIINPLIK